jgi:hypothetical protein
MTWWAMILTMIALQIFVMPFLGTETYTHVYFSMSQAWMGAAMGTFMAILGGLWPGGHGLELWEWATLVIVGVLSVLGYRYQLFVTDREYIHDMIPHHSMAILTSKYRLSSSNPLIARLAEQIIITQKQEIDRMKSILTE